MQPYFFPYLGYFQTMHAVDQFILYDQLHFMKNKFIHRNRYLCGSGQVRFFTVPIHHKSSFSLIHDLKVADQPDWRSKTKKIFEFNYSKTPFFEPVFHLICEVLDLETSSLAQLNAASIYPLSRITCSCPFS